MRLFNTINQRYNVYNLTSDAVKFIRIDQLRLFC